MKNIEQCSKNQYLYSNYKEIAFPVLKDMFKKSTTHNGLSNEQDELLDIVSSLLIKVHKDKTILPKIVDMIFFRNRKGVFTHDLIWTFFAAKDPYSLMLVANYLESEDMIDVKLASKLLNFVPSIDMTVERSSKNQCVPLFYWIKENYPFLYFTGESFQSSSNPTPYMVSLDAKYLCKRVSLNTGKPYLPLTEKENDIRSYFNNLDDENKYLLSSCSLGLHSENIYLWKSWINYSITKQIRIANARLKSYNCENNITIIRGE